MTVGRIENVDSGELTRESYWENIFQEMECKRACAGLLGPLPISWKIFSFWKNTWEVKVHKFATFASWCLRFVSESIKSSLVTLWIHQSCPLNCSFEMNETYNRPGFAYIKQCWYGCAPYMVLRQVRTVEMSPIQSKNVAKQRFLCHFYKKVHKNQWDITPPLACSLFAFRIAKTQEKNVNFFCPPKISYVVECFQQFLNRRTFWRVLVQGEDWAKQ